MAKLFEYIIELADPDDAADYNKRGIVRGELAELMALIEPINAAHGQVVFLAPVDEAAIGIDRLRIELGGALHRLHEGSRAEPICEADLPFAREWWIQTYGSEPPAYAIATTDRSQGRPADVQVPPPPPTTQQYAAIADSIRANLAAYRAARGIPEPGEKG